MNRMNGLFTFALIVLFCNIGLLYQTYCLAKDYLRGNTFVNIRIARIYNETLPAITICYPKLLSFERIADLNNDWKNVFESYVGFLENDLGVNATRLIKLTEKQKLDLLNYHLSYFLFSDSVLKNESLTEMEIIDKFSLNKFDNDNEVL